MFTSNKEQFVGNKGNDSLRVLGDFFHPDFHNVAIHGIVNVAAATETKHKSAHALDFAVRSQTVY